MFSEKQFLKEVAAKYNFRPRKSLGQNFIVDSNVLKKITTLTEVTKKESIVEIGSAYGNLTELLCQKAKFVYAIEIDKRLCEIAKERLKQYKNLKIINKDFLKLDLFKDSSLKVIGNLPYYITSPIILRLLEQKKFIKQIFITVQKEVAQRLVASPASKDYSALSARVNFYAIPKILMKISRSCFFPQPEVDSCLVRLDIRTKLACKVKNEDLMFTLIRASFNQRRKTISNALANAKTLNISKKTIETILEEIGIDTTRRGETLSLEEFAKVSDNVK